MSSAGVTSEAPTGSIAEGGVVERSGVLERNAQKPILILRRQRAQPFESGAGFNNQAATA
jgi:hypothetical protein